LPGHCGVIAPRRTAHRLSLRLSSPTPPDFEFTILPTARVLYLSRSSFLALSIPRVLLFPPALPAPTLLAPPLPHRETSVVTIFPGKGSDILSNASGSGTRYWTRWTSAQAVLSFGVVLFLAFWFSSYVLLGTSNSLVRLWRIGTGITNPTEHMPKKAYKVRASIINKNVSRITHRETYTAR